MDDLIQSETGNPSEIETGEVDRISHLPESIVHHILSTFKTIDAVPAELVRMSVLSKTWFHLTATFPILDFSSHNFMSRESFFKYVEYATTRFCHQNLTAQMFSFVAIIREPAELDVVSRCVDLVLKNGVQELTVFILNLSKTPLQKYRLPNALLSVSSMLKSLSLTGCDLPSSLLDDVVQFKSLIRLDFGNVTMDDEVITCLITSCPLLQEFHFYGCHGFKTFCTYGHPNLREVSFRGDNHVEIIDIDAPNLSKLMVVDNDGTGAPQMKLASCKKLTTVTYYGNPSPKYEGFTNFLSNFPFIEHLVLVPMFKFYNLKLSSNSLRTLVLQTEYDLEEIEFNTPNLALFIYTCDYGVIWHIIMNERWPLLRDSMHLKACMQCYVGNDIGTLWFLKLRQFLDKDNGFKVLNLYIHSIESQKDIELEKLKAVEWLPYELEHVVLSLDTREEPSANIAFVGAVLWCCRPRSLTLISLNIIEEQSDIVKFTFNKLLEQEVEGHIKIQIVSSSSSEAQMHLRDLKSLSMALHREGKAISFIKEEVVQEEASRIMEQAKVWRYGADALDLGVLSIRKV